MLRAGKPQFFEKRDREGGEEKAKGWDNRVEKGFWEFSGKEKQNNDNVG